MVVRLFGPACDRATTGGGARLSNAQEVQVERGTTRVLDRLDRCGGERVQVGAVLDAELVAKLRAYAAEDGRSVSNAIGRLLEKALADQQTSGAGWEAAEVRA